MKKGLTLFFLFLVLLALFLLFGAVEVSSQETSYITVMGSDLTNGVVIVDILKTGKTYEFQCNHGAPTCVALKSCRYQMVELPKNFGMYDCRDVGIYAESASDPVKDRKLGGYCLLEK